MLSPAWVAIWLPFTPWRAICRPHDGNWGGGFCCFCLKGEGVQCSNQPVLPYLTPTRPLNISLIQISPHKTPDADYHQDGERRDFTLCVRTAILFFLNMYDRRKLIKLLTAQTRKKYEMRGDWAPWSVWCNHYCQMSILINAGISF